jgi:hypothetical protein
VSGDRLRLLVCPKCRTVEPIEWCGTEPGQNPECGHPQCADSLMYRLSPHLVARHDGHYYHSNLLLTDVAQAEWDRLTTRKDILKNITAPGEATPYGAELYDVRSNFSADAARCWKAHNRTKDCQDWMHSSKRLVPATGEERKDLGLETRSKHIPTSTYLCQFCPMASIKRTKINAERYGYNT